LWVVGPFRLFVSLAAIGNNDFAPKTSQLIQDADVKSAQGDFDARSIFTKPRSMTARDAADVHLQIGAALRRQTK
jgi:hypothetical protein